MTPCQWPWVVMVTGICLAVTGAGQTVFDREDIWFYYGLRRSRVFLSAHVQQPPLSTCTVGETSWYLFFSGRAVSNSLDPQHNGADGNTDLHDRQDDQQNLEAFHEHLVGRESTTVALKYGNAFVCV